MGKKESIQRNSLSLVQGLQCPPILQFACFVAIVVPLI
jgi:hypothetical protein